MIPILTGLFLVQCTSSTDEPKILNQETKVQTYHPYKRSPEEAIGAVQEFLSQESELRGFAITRTIDKIVHLENVSELRSTEGMDDFSDKFYAVEFNDNKGYALVSKDIRTFPIFAILDTGRVDSKTLNSVEMTKHKNNMLKGFKFEVDFYNKALDQYRDKLRSHKGDASKNIENNINFFYRRGWDITRSTGVRLTSNWSQEVKHPHLYMNPLGASYTDVHVRTNHDNYVNPYWSNLSNWMTPPQAFGCTPVAFGQVMYALREEEGFNQLKYHSGEPVLWDLMDVYSSYNNECQRFLGWITMNCSPHIFDDQTMVFNINATKFLRNIIGDNIKSRYDNCVVSEGDFDGYGWSEDKRLAEEFFQYPKCFIIMTASSGSLNYVNYHSFVIDGMVEFKKRIQGSGFLGLGIFRKTHDGIRHLYHVNAGWGGHSNGYFLYVQNVDDKFEYLGSNDAMDYRSKVAYLIVRPS